MVTQQSRFLDQGCSTANKPRAFECQYGNVCDTYVIRPYVSDTIKNTGLFLGGDPNCWLQSCVLENRRGVLFVTDMMAWNQWLKSRTPNMHQLSTDHFEHNGKWRCQNNVFELCWNWKFERKNITKITYYNSTKDKNNSTWSWVK